MNEVCPGSKYNCDGMMATQLSDKAVWKTYGYWAFWTGIVFFTVYPACNWLTSKRSSPLALYFDYELNIPFVPGFVWVYLSMYLLFIAPPFFLDVTRLQHLGKQLVTGTFASGLLFLLFPSRLGFGRVIPADPFYGSIYANMFAVDLPHNMVPSLHVVFSALILLLMLDATRRTMFKLVWWSWLLLICISTILVHQHHIIDVVAGLAVAWGCRYWITKGGLHA